jgi:SulP family sulfate permease
MKQIAEMTKVQDITEHNKLVNLKVPDGWRVFKITGPLFFAAADRVFGELAQLCTKEQGVVLYLDGVSILDSGGVAALHKFIDKCSKSGTRIYLADFQFQPLKTLAKSGFRPDGVVCETYSTLSAALNALPASSVK